MKQQKAINAINALVDRRIGIKLQQTRNRLLHATEDIPDKELKEILRFIF